MADELTLSIRLEDDGDSTPPPRYEPTPTPRPAPPLPPAPAAPPTPPPARYEPTPTPAPIAGAPPTPVVPPQRIEPPQPPEQPPARIVPAFVEPRPHNYLPTLSREEQDRQFAQRSAAWDRARQEQAKPPEPIERPAPPSPPEPRQEMPAFEHAVGPKIEPTRPPSAKEEAIPAFEHRPPSPPPPPPRSPRPPEPQPPPQPPPMPEPQRIERPIPRRSAAETARLRWEEGAYERDVAAETAELRNPGLAAEKERMNREKAARKEARSPYDKMASLANAMGSRPTARILRGFGDLAEYQAVPEPEPAPRAPAPARMERPAPSRNQPPDISALERAPVGPRITPNTGTGFESPASGPKAGAGPFEAIGKAGAAAEGGAAAGGAAGGMAGMAEMAGERAGGPIGIGLAIANEAGKAIAAQFNMVGNAAKVFGESMSRLARNDNVGAITKAVDGVAEGLGKIPVVGQVFEAAIKAVTAPVRVFAEVVEAFVARGRELAQYNGALAGANARAEVKSLMADIKEANELGPDLAKLTNSWSDLQSEFRDIMLPIKQAIINILIPMVEQITAMVKVQVDGIKNANVFYELFSDLHSDLMNWNPEKFGTDILDAIEKIRKIHEDRELREKMKDQTIGSELFTKQMDAMRDAFLKNRAFGPPRRPDPIAPAAKPL